MFKPQDQFGREAAAYWFIDGLPEVFFGLALAAIGGLGFAWRMWFPNVWMLAAFILAGLVFLTLFIWDRRIIAAVKARLTYPRTGYVPPPRQGPPEGQYLLTMGSASEVSARQNASTFRMGGICFLLIGPALTHLFRGRWGIAVAMAVIGIAVYFGRQWSERPYSWRSALILAISGVPFALMNVPERPQNMLAVFLSGTWLLAQGVWQFAHYVRREPDRISR